MVKKKTGTIDNSDYLKKVRENAKNAFDKAENAKNAFNKAENREKEVKKTKEESMYYIDINLMDSAPNEWNVTPRIKDQENDKYMEMKLSILAYGIIEPLLLWKQVNGRYMIIAGHNRRDICEDIIKENKDNPDFDYEKFQYLPCIVKDFEDLTEQEVSDMIDDSNLYRSFNKLPKEAQLKYIKRRFEYYKKQSCSKIEGISKLMNDLGLKKTAIYENLSIDKNIIQELQNLYFEGKLTRKAVLKFLNFDKETQSWIFSSFKDKIEEKKVLALKKNMQRNEIEELFNSEDKVGVKKMIITIPAHREKEFRELLKNFLDEK